MNFRTRLAIFSATTSRFILQKVLHRSGTALPGKIALKIQPNLLKDLNQNLDVVIVTGTNGKTLTTALCTKILTNAGYQVITNSSGSNMIQGIVDTIITQTPSHPADKLIAILEVDEANVEVVTESLKPKFFVLTNIFRDQMDRYGEIYTIYDKILAGIKKAPESTVIVNGDSPIFQRDKPSNPEVYYGFNHDSADHSLPAPSNTDGILSPTDNSILHYRFLTYANLGSYYSVTDDFKRPPLKYCVTKVDELTPKFSKFEIDTHPFKIEIGGLYNIYNALAAYSLARELGISPATIKDAFEQNQQIFGRQEAISVGDKELTIVLVKNPVGANAVIDMMMTEPDPFSLIVLLNANYADGIDTSWIWDTDFEKLHQANVKQVTPGGERWRDISVRLKMADFKIEEPVPDLKQVIEKIKTAPTKKVYLAATYTAMLQLRQQLAASGYIKGGF
ncbi:Mur ligase family protein [Xylocopilactobacillus apicola]|uniref:Lipid II isoglutaminyl synthase (glutamine-hydrolyzing) subunit MurT n=1 Tax=Xylocopilactobacillus apicola TaxID=2932184 RepID=A0AAU9CZR8_9LACO|nr:Mur ligase family protein [Xylocopilactobacillus apicola]BDR57921.1 UDP-N-acetylmuramyl peptide synthase [Xylocopilactobacillus apicola]